MNEFERDEAIRAFLDAKCFPILKAKGAASTGGTEDPNKGFDNAACPDERVDRHIVWWIYFAKQVFRFKNWIFRRTSAEPVGEMLADIINYALIEVSMLAEDGLLDFEGNPFRKTDKPQ